MYNQIKITFKNYYRFFLLSVAIIVILSSCSVHRKYPYRQYDPKRKGCDCAHSEIDTNNQINHFTET